MPQLPGAQGAPYGLISGPLEPSRYANLKTALACRPANYAETLSDRVKAFDMTLRGAGWPVQSSNASAP